MLVLLRQVLHPSAPFVRLALHFLIFCQFRAALNNEAGKDADTETTGPSPSSISKSKNALRGDQTNPYTHLIARNRRALDVQSMHSSLDFTPPYHP